MEGLAAEWLRENRMDDATILGSPIRWWRTGGELAFGMQLASNVMRISHRYAKFA
jgi:hypothetical protein